MKSSSAHDQPKRREHIVCIVQAMVGQAVREHDVVLSADRFGGLAEIPGVYIRG